jgi:uncharacterized membrane protein
VIASVRSRVERIVVDRVIDWVRPDPGSPSTPLATVAWLDSFEPSLMPRTSLLQGALGGLAILSSKAVADRTERVLAPALGPRTALDRRLSVRLGVVVGGRLVGALVHASGLGLRRWLGPGAAKRGLAAALNTGLWTSVAVGTYNWGVARVGTTNRTIEPGYDRPPSADRVSGSPASASGFLELGRQGRRFVSDGLDGAAIAAVLGESTAADPIRVYVGYDSEPLYSTGRAEQALEELERTGAYDRGHLLLLSPTGTGWVDQTAVEAAELLTRGDIATCAIQYGTYPSFLAVQTVALGRMQFRILLLGVRERLRAMPPERRPRVLVFGESLGAWTSSDVVMHQGLGGFDHYGIDRALWVGMPFLAKWSRSGMIRGSSDLVPPGTVGVFDRHEQLAALPRDERERLRAVILSHDNDPVALLGPDLIVQRPEWLRGTRRGRGVPRSMRWIPIVTFLQTFADAMNSMIQVPGHFSSFGHDYRADLARFVRDTYRLPEVTADQMAAIDRTLVELDLARAQRLAATHEVDDD